MSSTGALPGASMSSASLVVCAQPWRGALRRPKAWCALTVAAAGHVAALAALATAAAMHTSFLREPGHATLAVKAAEEDRPGVRCGMPGPSPMAFALAGYQRLVAPEYSRCQGSKPRYSDGLLAGQSEGRYTRAPSLGREALAGNSSMAAEVVQCMVTSPLDAFEVSMETWLVPSPDQASFLESADAQHRVARRSLDDRRLRGYEKGMYLLFKASCQAEASDLASDGAFCAECRFEQASAVQTNLGELRTWEPRVEQAIDFQECFAISPQRRAPRCLFAKQRLKSWKLFSVQPPMWSNSGGVSPLQ